MSYLHMKHSIFFIMWFPPNFICACEVFQYFAVYVFLILFALNCWIWWFFFLFGQRSRTVHVLKRNVLTRPFLRNFFSNSKERSSLIRGKLRVFQTLSFSSLCWRWGGGWGMWSGEDEQNLFDQSKAIPWRAEKLCSCLFAIKWNVFMFLYVGPLPCEFTWSHRSAGKNKGTVGIHKKVLYSKN